MSGNSPFSFLCSSTYIIGDIDWTRCPTTQKLTTGYCILLGSSPKTMKQFVVVRSTIEEEYHTMALTCYEITWQTDLLKDMRLSNLPPTIMQSDNEATLSIAANPVLHERTKYIELDHHYIWDKISYEFVTTAYVLTHHQLAELMIKPLPTKQHNHLLHKIEGLVARPLHHLEGE